jgi:Zn-dependent peptidase ImmA (M78 family)
VKRGFKAGAERIADETRAELRLNDAESLDPLLLAKHLCVPVLTMAQLAAVAPGNSFNRYFSVVDLDTFSAVTVFRGTKRLIVHNEHHHPNRQASNLSHELSHILLEHPPTALAGKDGRRHWNPEVEEEAAWLGAALLVPRSGILRMVKARCSVIQIAASYGVSESLCVWRIRQSGVHQQAERWRAWRR